jgi:hypothetical protein
MKVAHARHVIVAPCEQKKNVHLRIARKGRRFDESYTEIHAFTCSEPLVAGAFFSVVMGLDATYKEGGRRTMKEVCVYEVANDKIVREQFFYS